MTRTARLALGAASALPALVVAGIPTATDALLAVARANAAVPDALTVSLMAVLGAGLAVPLYFAWRAAGQSERGFGWKLGWVLALTLFGVAAAPVFWYVHVRQEPASVRTA